MGKHKLSRKFNQSGNLPRLIINFKTYEQGSGKAAIRLAKALDISGIALTVQNSDIYRIARSVRVPVFAQHLDPVGHGQFTGSDIASTLKANGASGVFINHSEDRVNMKIIRQAVGVCKKEKLLSVVLISRPSLARQVAAMRPDILAIEPPELIGTGISVSRAKPQVITGTINTVKNTRVPVYCGAGISTSQDVSRAMKLGCAGVLTASAVVLSKNPRKLAKSMLEAM